MRAKFEDRAEGFLLILEVTPEELDDLATEPVGKHVERTLRGDHIDLAALCAAADGKHARRLSRLAFQIRPN